MKALPPTLERFGAELESAVRRDLGSRRRRRWMRRGAAFLVVAGAAALGILAFVSVLVVERFALRHQRPDETRA